MTGRSVVSRSVAWEGSRSLVGAVSNSVRSRAQKMLTGAVAESPRIKVSADTLSGPTNRRGYWGREVECAA